MYEDEIDPRVVKTLIFIASIYGKILGVLICTAIVSGFAWGILSLLQWVCS